jgi:hypothetical protein
MEGRGRGEAQGVADPKTNKQKKQSPNGRKFAQSGHPDLKQQQSKRLPTIDRRSEGQYVESLAFPV